MTKYRVLELLKQADSYLSGEELSLTLGVSRTAVWKAVKSLRNDGYEIEAVTNRGYRFVSPADRFSEYEIRKGLLPGVIGSSIRVFDVLDSTNDYAKTLASSAENNGCVILAERQNLGKAKDSGAFYSPEQSGLYISIILHPQCYLEQFSKLREQVVESVRETIADTAGKEAEYRAPNEFFYESKKLCGILHELSLEGETGRIQSVVVGIGIYVNHMSFPEEVPGISLRQMAGKEIDRVELVCRLLNHLQKRLNCFLS